MAKLSDYPFDPRHENEPEHLRGLDKTRAFRSDRMRRAVFIAMCTAARVPCELDEPEPAEVRRAAG